MVFVVIGIVLATVALFYLLDRGFRRAAAKRMQDRYRRTDAPPSAPSVRFTGGE